MNSYQEVIKNICLNDERFVVFTAENRAVVRELPEILNDRFIDVGITEQNMIGMASGMALQGRIPICHALTNFLLFRAYEFIRNDVGIPCLPVKLSGWIPGFLSDGNGPTHQSLEDVGIMRLIPNMQIFCPSDNEDMVKMLPEIWNSPFPCYLRVNVRESKIKHSKFEIGIPEIIKIGKDATILVYGFLLEEVLIAEEILKNKGLNIGIVNVRTLSPLDQESILNICDSTSNLIVVEDHFEVGGLKSILSEIIVNNNKNIKLFGINMGKRWFKPGLLSEVLEYEGFTGQKIADKISTFINI